MVSDGFLSDSETISVTVGDVNVAPVLDPVGDQSGDELSLISFTLMDLKVFSIKEILSCIGNLSISSIISFVSMS